MAVVAGARDFEVGGPDTLHYGNSVFYAAVASSDFSSLVNWTRGAWFEGDNAYFFFNFVVSRITNDVRIFYFWLSILNSAIVLTAIMIVRDLGSTGLMWFTYLAMHYHRTFNTLRSSPATALGLLAVALILKGKPVLGIAVATLGLSFHSSAVVSIIVAIIAVFVMRVRRAPNRLAWLGIALAFLGALNFSYLVEIWRRVGGGRFMGYFSEFHRLGGGRGLIPSDAVRLVGAIVAGYLLWQMGREIRTSHIGTSKNGVVFDHITATLSTIMIVELLLIPLRPVAFPMARAISYFGIIAVIAYPAFAAQFPRLRLEGNVMVAAAAISASIFGNPETRIYSSAILTDSTVDVRLWTWSLVASMATAVVVSAVYLGLRVAEDKPIVGSTGARRLHVDTPIGAAQR